MTIINQKIPEGWSVKKLGECTLSFSGGTPSVDKTEYYENGKIPFIRSGEIYQDFTELFITKKGLKESSAKMVKKGDLLLALYGANSGDSSVCKIDGAINQAILCIRTKEDNLNFLESLFVIYKDKVIHKYLQGGQGNLSAEIIKSLCFMFPPLCEQEKIAEILGTWDLAIEKLTALIEQKKLLKKGLMQRLLTGKQRLPGFSEPWKKVKLGECFSFLKTSSYSRAETTDCGEVHYIHYGDIHTKYPLHIFPKDINIYISTKQASKSDCLKTGDLILLDASEDYEGTTKCVELLNISDDEKVVSGLHTLALRDSTQNFINGFRAYITSIPFVKNNFWKQVTGIKVYGVSKDNLKKIKIPIPSLSEQKAIADILSKADEEIDLLTRKLDLLQSQKKGLMQQLLTGKIRVKVA